MNPLVSICCITYNHEEYIADAIDSFLMQKTDFPFEIIIHDDASIDNTAAIIRHYEKNYPEIIRPIYQKENQYSKGKEIIFECVFPYVKGEFIAFCEGDDFWSDANKLQMQVDFLIKNNTYSACFHSVEIIDIHNVPNGRYLGPVGKGNRKYGMDNNIIGGFIHISSLLMRSRFILNGMPEWAIKSRHGDYALALFISANGDVYFLDRVMSKHRTGVKNSVMTKLRENYTKENEINYHTQRNKTLEDANKYYNYQYDNQILKVVYDSKIRILLLKNRYAEILDDKYRAYFKDKGIINILKLVLLTKMPKVSRGLSLIKGKLKIQLGRFKRGH